MIMVGPGTGVAPFLGFLHERRALGHTGRNWLFFGEQHPATDFYYRDELRGYAPTTDARPASTPAFSRDQRQKVYVQDRMREHGAELWALAAGRRATSTSAATPPAWPRTSTTTLREIVAHARRPGRGGRRRVREAARGRQALRARRVLIRICGEAHLISPYLPT